MNAAERILVMEQARNEENKRLNSEREILLVLAPDLWDELKEAFKAECAKLSRATQRLQFECDEPDAQTFHINRMVGDVAIRAMEFTFDPRVPRVVFEIHWGKKTKGSIGFLVVGSHVLFANGTSGVVLSDFVLDSMLRITR